MACRASLEAVESVSDVWLRIFLARRLVLRELDIHRPFLLPPGDDRRDRSDVQRRTDCQLRVTLKSPLLAPAPGPDVARHAAAAAPHTRYTRMLHSTRRMDGCECQAEPPGVLFTARTRRLNWVVQPKPSSGYPTVIASRRPGSVRENGSGCTPVWEAAATREGIEMFTGFDSSTGTERLLLGAMADAVGVWCPDRIGAPASGRWKWPCDGDRAGPPVRLIGCLPEDVGPAVGWFLRLLNQGRLRDVRLGRGRRTSESAVGDAGRPGEVDGVPPSVRSPVQDEAGRRPEGAPVRPPFARHAGTVLRTHRPSGASGVTADVRAPNRPDKRMVGGERDAAGYSA